MTVTAGLLVGLAVVCIFEGLRPLVAPRLAARTWARLALAQPVAIRIAGFISVTVGIVLLILSRSA